MEIKNILVPTDFSECAGHAIQFAADFCDRTGAHLQLLSCYQIPVVTTDITYTYDAEMVKKFEEDAKSNFDEIEREFPALNDIRYDYTIDLAYPQEGIINSVKDGEFDLIIMGTKGASGIASRLLGSVSSSVINNSPIPVLVIPQSWEIAQIEKIAFASDYKSVEDLGKFDILKAVAKVFEAKLMIVNVKEKIGDTTFDQAFEAKKLDSYLEGIDHSFHFTTGKNVEQALESFMKSEEVQMVAMMPRKHNLFERIILGSSTKKMALHAKVPLLTFR